MGRNHPEALSLMQRIVVVMCLFALYSCQDRVICPAFQSTYILDDSTRNAHFSYVWQLDEETRTQFLANNSSQPASDDSLQIGVVSQPKTDYYAYAGETVVPWRVPKRNKYGIQKKVPYPIKNYRLRTSPMENVLSPEPITNSFVASDFTDSLSLDSTAIASDSLDTKPVVAKAEIKYLYKYDPKDNFNVEQEYYNKYFGDKFIDNRPKRKISPVNQTEVESVPDSLQTIKEPFFKRLFKKKTNSDTTAVGVLDQVIPPVENDSTAVNNN